MRMRTTRTEKYFTVSNQTAQDNNLSFEALGLLTYCLSMPLEWDFHPKVIWKSRNCGRDSCYEMFNELIRSYHCIRVRKPNPKIKNLAGEIEYEIFDDVEDCKKRIFVLEKTDNFLEHGGNFNKSFRRPSSQDTELGETENQDLLKETQDIKETPMQKKQQQAKPILPAAAVSFYKELKDVDIPLSDKIEISKAYPVENVKHALLWLQKNEKPLHKPIAAVLKWASKNLPDIPKEKVIEKSPIDPAPFNKTYYRDLNTIAAKNGIRLYNEGLREGTSEYLETENDRIYYKDMSFLEQVANYLRKKSLDCRNVYEMIKVCQKDLVKQLC